MRTNRKKANKSDEPSPKPFVEKLNRVKAIVRELLIVTGERLYELVGLLRELFDDEDYRIRLSDRFPDLQTDDGRVREIFNEEYLAEVRELFGLDYVDFIEVLEKFPNVDSWRETPIPLLYQEAMEAKANASKSDRSDPARRAPITRAKFEELQRKFNLMQEENHRLKVKLADALREILELRDRVAECELQPAI